MHKLLIPLSLVGAISMSPLVLAHFDDKEIPQSYRQSYFALIAGNFGPLVSMIKGEMPWDDAMAESFASDLDDLGDMNIMRAFGPGSDKGTTRAKPEIWENMADFNAKMDDMQAAISAIEDAAESGDRKAIAGAVGAAGKTCKACHDEYKSKDYLY
ncbi:MAG: cytochrome c [Pseudomonadota bacterium]